MLSKIKKIKRSLLRRLDLLESKKYGRVSFSQEGEDVLLWRILDSRHQNHGTFVEVGCNHPWKCSNTAFFYQQGWSGVAIDPNPDFAKLFAAERPRDVFLNMGISAIEGELIYHRFDESLLNTFSAEQAMSVMSKKRWNKIDEIKVEVIPLAKALFSVWPSGREIDLLSIDAEGMDEEIIASHDFSNFPVRFLIVEFDDPVLDLGKPPKIAKILNDHGYLFISKLLKSGIFMREDQARLLGFLPKES